VRKGILKEILLKMKVHFKPGMENILHVVSAAVKEKMKTKFCFTILNLAIAGDQQPVSHSDHLISRESAPGTH
jgi:hypothetical protein